jgi:hypothetical protein
MSDFTAVPLQAQELTAELAASSANRAKAFITGLFFAAAVAFVGVAVVSIALVVGTVGAPVLALAIGYAVVRHRRAVPALDQAR